MSLSMRRRLRSELTENQTGEVYLALGAIAQLGERLNGIQEVGGSTPPGSTK